MFKTFLGLWILSCEKAIQLAYIKLMVLCGCNQGLPSPVKLENCHMTSTLLVQTKPPKKSTVAAESKGTLK
jgi:hypothetical protein